MASVRLTRMREEDESQLIADFAVAHGIDDSQILPLSKVTLRHPLMRKVMEAEKDYVYAAPVLVKKVLNTSGRPHQLAGVFISAADVALKGMKVAPVKRKTFSDVMENLREQSTDLEGGLIGVLPTRSWMRQGISALFASGDTIQRMDRVKRESLLTAVTKSGEALIRTPFGS